MKCTNLPILKIEGRSGCRLEVINNDGVYRIRKFSKDASYNTRLVLQAGKQKDFLLRKPSNDFFTPEVIAISEGEDIWFEMPYLHGQKFSEFFERSSIVEVKKLAEKLNRYFERSFAEATIKPIDKKIFHDKINVLADLLLSRKDIDQLMLDRVFKFLKKIPGSSLPERICHGDFTFSNMIFCEDGIYLVDFLDSFIESPLIDIVKLRQDTYFYWSLLIENSLPESRSAKIIQVFNYIDAEVTKGLSGNVFVDQWYGYLQIFNLLRILPYVHRVPEIQFVEQGIKKIFNTAQ